MFSDSAGTASRIDILKRFIRTMVCMLAFELVRILSYCTIFVQFAFCVVTGSPAAALRDFGNRLSHYAYKLLRYSLLNENRRPFPFSDLPEEGECEAKSSTIDFS
ncbi:DUF4389 domain-containing protein [Maridesulfovibrio sp. FT414]|uniref:DUF4389 domain-containing protein n=1 Tax=Maridesulfovibrio sp. FT414 TaxID=2979469 RepID=UPI003D8026C1